MWYYLLQHLNEYFCVFFKNANIIFIQMNWWFSYSSRFEPKLTVDQKGHIKKD